MEPTQANDRSAVDYSLLPGTTYHFTGPGYILSVAETADGIMVVISDSSSQRLSSIAYEVENDCWNFSPPRGVCASPDNSFHAPDGDLTQGPLTIDSSRCLLSIRQYSNKGPLLIVSDRQSDEELGRTWADLFNTASSPDQEHRYWKGSDVTLQKKHDGLS